MDETYRQQMKKELSYYDGSLKGLILNYEQSLKYRYIYHLRCIEYYANKKGLYNQLMCAYHKYRERKYSYILGFQIPPFTCGWGLRLRHFGHIIINSDARIGENAMIYPGTNVGKTDKGVPVIGDNCYLGLGCKVQGKINVGNNVLIAPNAVVTKDVGDNLVIGGVNKVLSI